MRLNSHPGHSHLNGRINEQEFYRFVCAEPEAKYERLRIAVFSNDAAAPLSEAIYLVPYDVGPEVYEYIDAHLCHWMSQPAATRRPIYAWVFPSEKLEDGSYQETLRGLTAH